MSKFIPKLINEDRGTFILIDSPFSAEEGIKYAKQHYHEIKNDRYNYLELKERDNYKDQWCKDNNIKLVRIPYTDYEILDSNYMRRIIQRNGWKEI